ncbi:putative quinol monooxygenase [Nostoc sp.]|uniref:putative quinol monooxygenase n=1 Tax=Nostoc sp. TaxID=1180 RepID=UPI002FF86348
MTKIPVTVLVLTKAKPGMEERVRNEILGVVQRALQEPTCIHIYLHQDVKDRTNFMLYENWTDKEDFINVQMKSPHLQDYLKRCKEFLVDLPEISLWEMRYKEEGADVNHTISAIKNF